MENHVNKYYYQLVGNTIQVLKKLINLNDCNAIVEELSNRYLQDGVSLKFQTYYFSILENKEIFLKQDNFFSKFRSQYGLQGFDLGYQQKLTNAKGEILNLIEKAELSTLYFNYFKTVDTKWGQGRRISEQGSFFTKLVHTFKPDNYCPLDGPIKKMLGLEKEGFFLSFLVVSEAYQEFCLQQDAIIIKIRKKLKERDRENVINHDSLSNIKLMDLILWNKANPL